LDNKNSKRRILVLSQLAVLFVTIEMMVFARKYIVPYPVSSLAYPQKLVDAIRNDSGADAVFRILTLNHTSHVTIRKNQASKLQNVNGYSMVNPNFNRFYFAMYYGSTKAASKNLVVKTTNLNQQVFKFAQVMNVKYYISGQPFKENLKNLFKPIYEENYANNQGLFVYKNVGYLRRAWLVHKVQHMSDDEQAKKLISGQYDFRNQAMVSGSSSFEYKIPQAGQNSYAKILTYSPEEIEIEAEAQENGLMVMSDVYLKNWTAYVDGKKQEILRTNLAFRGIELTKGKHKIIMKYESPAFTIGAVISIISLAITLSLLWFLPRLKQP